MYSRRLPQLGATDFDTQAEFDKLTIEDNMLLAEFVVVARTQETQAVLDLAGTLSDKNSPQACLYFVNEHQSSIIGSYQTT